MRTQVLLQAAAARLYRRCVADEQSYVQGGVSLTTGKQFTVVVPARAGSGSAGASSAKPAGSQPAPAAESQPAPAAAKPSASQPAPAADNPPAAQPAPAAEKPPAAQPAPAAGTVGLKPAALAAFPTATGNMEGRVFWMYADNRNLITTGMGNLIDPVGAALTLPWKHGATGPAASADEIRAAWQKVKDFPNPNKVSGASSEFSNLTDLRLSAADVDALVSEKVQTFWRTLLKSFPKADTWPADGQLALLFMSWALGAGFAATYPSFKRAVLAEPPDFEGAIAQAGWSNENNDRRQAIAHLFQNAADVLKSGASPDTLYWPNDPTGAAKWTSDTAARGMAKSS